MLKPMKSRFLIVHDEFYRGAKTLRQTFDHKFADPLKGHNERFVWDYWHVPNQYTLHRTPADHYFGKAFSPFVKQLVDWGQENLGCASISPPWLSYYVAGCEQRLHCDNPHGPWAFVYSLSLKPGMNFQGGETLILKPEVLEYWSHHNSQSGLEENGLFWKVSPKFNRLVVFDPRFPHGVNRVTGTQDPREARLVIHGWFTQPQPILKGPIKASEFNTQLNELLHQLEDVLQQRSALTGTLSYKIKLNASGKVTQVKALTHTLMSKAYQHEDVKHVAAFIFSELKRFEFSRPSGSRASVPREIILPLIFD